MRSRLQGGLGAPKLVGLLVAVVVAAGLSLTLSASAFAAGVKPATDTVLPDLSSLSDLQPSCAAGQVKLDYEFINFGMLWGNTCGFYNWPYDGPNDPLWEVRVASNPSDYRIWLHQDWPTGGWSYCMQAPGKDVQVPAQYSEPGSIQISGNTAKC